MSAKNRDYKNRWRNITVGFRVSPEENELINKAVALSGLVRCFQAIDDYHRLNVTNANLYRENERLSKVNEKLAAENENLRAENKDYKLLRKVFGSKQIDSLLEQAKQSKQRDKRFRNKENER